MSHSRARTAATGRRILFCTDFSENAEFAFGFALEAARQSPGSRLYLLHVIPEPDAQFWKTYIYELDDPDRKARHDIDARVAQSYASRVPEGQAFEAVMRIGRDAPEILLLADEVEADLIVMGRHGHGPLSHLLFGSVTQQVLRKARCPVVVIPLAYRERLRAKGRPDALPTAKGEPAR